MKITSRKQARFLGFIAGGGKPKGGKGPSQGKAQKMMMENRGMKMRDMPERAPQRGAKRVSRRGRR